MKEYAECGYTGYARVLGFKKGASELIRFMNEKANVPVITRCADTGRVPPARGVMVSAAALPAGLRTVRIELTAVVVTTAIPTI